MNDRAWMLAESLGHWALAWSMVVLAVACGLRLARARRANVRYACWLLATFAGLGLLPIVAATGPRLSWRDTLAWLHRPGPAPRQAPAGFRSWFADEAAAPARGDLPATARREGVDRPVREWAAPTLPVAQSAPAPRAVGERWSQVACLVWAAGFVLFAVRLVVAGVRVGRLRAEADSAVPEELRVELADARRRLGIRRGVRVAIHREIGAPLCLGLFRPLVLWPDDGRCPMTPAQRRAAMIHELAHLKHGDDWVGLAAEAWRALTWFYPPVHWTLARLLREREYRCDDLAAGQLEGPASYARWLLDLAPVGVAPSPLASSILGSGGLADRVRRILDGETTRARPVSRRQAAALVVAGLLLLAGAGSVRLVGFVGRVRAAEPADAPLPDITASALADKIEAAWKAYEIGSLEVQFEDERPTPRPEGGKPKILKVPGRVRYLSDGRRWRVEYDSQMMGGMSPRKLVPYRWTTGFDGKDRFTWMLDQNLVTLGVADPAGRHFSPRALFWYNGDSLVKGMREPSGPAIGQRTVDGIRCYVLSSSHGDYSGETVISPRQGYLPIRLTWRHKGRMYFSYQLDELEQTRPGVWAPRRFLSKSPDGLEGSRKARVVRYEPGQAPDPSAYEFTIPVEADVTDPRLGYAYHNDPWWPEAGKLLRERFDRPQAGLSSLFWHLGTTGEAKLDGQPAPPIRADAWIGSGPVAWDQLRGKVVLVVFWHKDSPNNMVAALRRLYQIDHPAGLEIVAIHGPTADTEAVRQFAREYQIPYPIAIDARSDSSEGVTAKAFGAAGDAAVLIDHTGKVRVPGPRDESGGKLIATMTALLKQAGARDVRTLDPEDDRLTRPMIDALETAFREWPKSAPAASGITGKVTDGQGLPIEGARVEAGLRLSFLNAPFPGSYYHTRSQVSATTSGPDGQFAILGLCKGTYNMTFRAEGKAIYEDTATIAADLRPATANAVLDQGDTIGGRVVDDEGRPIAGAVIGSTQRSYERNGNTTTTSAALKQINADEEGRFQLRGLSFGGYTLDVTALGFAKGRFEKVPAGSADVKLVLKRAP